MGLLFSGVFRAFGGVFNGFINVALQALTNKYKYDYQHAQYNGHLLIRNYPKTDGLFYVLAAGSNIGLYFVVPKQAMLIQLLFKTANTGWQHITTVSVNCYNGNFTTKTISNTQCAQGLKVNCSLVLKQYLIVDGKPIIFAIRK